MPRTLRLFLIIGLCLAFIPLCACRPSPQSSKNPEEIRIVTSFYPIYIDVINITRDIPGVAVVNLTQPDTGCLHDYQLTAGDMKTLETADVFVINGAGMEEFLEKVTSRMPNLTVIDASENIPLLADGFSHSDEPDHSYNPHIFVSILGSIRQVENISDGLADSDPDRAGRYAENADRYLEKLHTLEQKFASGMEPFKGTPIVTFHEAFAYFARDYGLQIAAVIEREPGSQPSAAELRETVETIKARKVKAIFAEPQYSAAAAETISRETGVSLYSIDPIVTGEANLENFDGYLLKMEENLRVFTEALHK